MKKFGQIVLVFLLSVGMFTGCGTSYKADESTVFVLKDGKIVSTDVENFDEKTYDKDGLKEYVKNEIDTYNEKNGTDIVDVARSYTAPLALYSDKYKALGELEDGAEILIANDPTNLARSLILLDKNGIIKLKDPNNVVATLEDIVENPKNLKITTITADQIAIRLKEVGAAVIPGNYAVKNGLNPRESLAVESKDSPYVNIIAV